MTTVLDHSVIVRVERPLGYSLGALMSEIRSWLDQNRVMPVDFRPTMLASGLRCDLKFATAKDADLFKAAFDDENAGGSQVL